MRRTTAVPVFALIALSVAACAEPLSFRGSEGRTVTASLGQEVRITLGTVGPGAYESPPAVSSLVVHFLDMAYVGPAVPSGPTQEFRFQAVAVGRAIITFHHSGNNPTVSDTVDVR